MLADPTRPRADLLERVVQPSLHVAARALACDAHSSRPPAETHRAGKLGGQRFELLGGTLGASRITPRFGFVADRGQLAQPLAVGLAGRRVDDLTSVAAIDGLGCTGELEDMVFASGLGNEPREHLDPPRALDVHLLAETADYPELADLDDHDTAIVTRGPRGVGHRRRSEVRDP